MKAAKKMTGVLLASAAAGLILAGCAGSGVKSAASSGATATKAGLFKCQGVNACKGKSSCKTATSQCKGFNSCKGKGWIPNSASNCLSAGGVVGDPLFSDSTK